MTVHGGKQVEKEKLMARYWAWICRVADLKSEGGKAGTILEERS